MTIAKRVAALSPSPTLTITAKVKKMKAEGIDVIGFGAGEPDFDTPLNIKAAAVKAIEAGFTKYTPTSGIDELKDAIIAKLKRDNGLEYKKSEILVSCGAKHSLFNAVLTLCDDGDEVIIPAPYWVSYPEQVKLAGGKSVIIESTDAEAFKIKPEQLKKAVTSRTRLLVLNSPGNPTGSVYNRQELNAFAEVAVEKNFFVLSDEIYEKILYDGEEHVSIASFGPEIKVRTVLVNGHSKAYSMTGWRIGYLAAAEKLVKAMSQIQDHSTSNPTSIAQKAAVEALNGSQDDLKKMVAEFDKRRRYMVERLNKIKGISCLMPKGAFYAFPKVSELFGKRYKDKTIKNSDDFADYLLDFVKVAAVPGSGFGADEYIRLSYATSMENIVKELDRIEEAVSNLS